jgi:DNA-binding protein HU-beta
MIAAMTEAETEALKKGDTEEGGQGRADGLRDLRGLGACGAQGRNPQTGKAIKGKASKARTFKAGKALRDAVR